MVPFKKGLIATGLTAILATGAIFGVGKVRELQQQELQQQKETIRAYEKVMEAHFKAQGKMVGKFLGSIFESLGESSVFESLGESFDILEQYGAIFESYEDQKSIRDSEMPAYQRLDGLGNLSSIATEDSLVGVLYDFDNNGTEDLAYTVGSQRFIKRGRLDGTFGKAEPLSREKYQKLSSNLVRKYSKGSLD